MGDRETESVHGKEKADDVSRWIVGQGLIIKTTGKTVYNPHQSAVPVFAISF